MVQGILNRSRELGYHLLFWEVAKGDDKIPEIILRKDVDGVIFLQDIDWNLLGNLNQMDVPFIVADAHNSPKEVDTVKTNYHTATCRAMEYLIQMGHRDIAFISAEDMPDYYLQCFSAYKEALEEQGLFMNSAWIQSNAGNEETAYDCTAKIMRAEKKPTAIFCSADSYAIGAIKYLKENNIKVPEQVSVIGIDNILFSSYMEPGITSVEIDKKQMGSLAMEMIYNKIDGKTVKPSELEPGEIVVRSSVARPSE